MVSRRYSCNSTSSSGRCTYDHDGLSLECIFGSEDEVVDRPLTLAEQIDRRLGIVDVQTLIVNVDTLCFVCRHGDRKLISFDAFTNAEFWLVDDRLSCPANVPVLGDLFATGSDNAEIRATLPGAPVYVRSPNWRRLRIQLIEARAEQYVQIAAGVIVGLADGQIVDLCIEGLVMEHSSRYLTTHRPWPQSIG